MESSYSRRCPYCGTEDELDVISGIFLSHGMPLTSAGFFLGDAKQCDTSDERVKCRKCLRIFDLSQVTLA